MILLNYFLFSFSILGYGLIFAKIMGVNIRNFGFIGFYGLSFLTFLSYLSSLIFIVHDTIFNLIILFLGLLFFTLILKEKINLKKNFIIHLIVFFILIVFISSAKTYDDFPYYHFPYSYLLTQMEHPLGLGYVNPGFRNHSSLFFLNSLFYLPITKIYLMQIYPVFFLGFANIILLNIIFNKNTFTEFKFINFLSLLILSFINTFFYRISEYGTDRPGMIFIFVITILIIIIFKNSKNAKFSNDNLDLFYSVCIFLSFLVTMKPSYLIYGPLALLVLFSLKINFFKVLISRPIIYSFSLCVVYFFFNFINCGCIIYPLDFTCFYNFPWSIGKNFVVDYYEWIELWSKAGASPNYIIEDRQVYLSGINWVENWIDNYFFNKVSDFLLGLLFLLLIFYIFFLRKNLKLVKNNFNIYRFLIIYVFFIIIFFEWFFNHPQLRYGGYHVIALLFFMPLAYSFNSTNFKFNDFLKKTKIIIAIVLLVFFARNTDRLLNEKKQYNFNPFVSLKYSHNDELFKYMEYINEEKNNFMKINFFGKEFLVTRFKIK